MQRPTLTLRCKIDPKDELELSSFHPHGHAPQISIRAMSRMSGVTVNLTPEDALKLADSILERLSESASSSHVITSQPQVIALPDCDKILTELTALRKKVEELVGLHEPLQSNPIPSTKDTAW